MAHYSHRNPDAYYRNKRNFPETLRNVIKSYYDQMDYHELVQQYSARHCENVKNSIHVDLRHALYCDNIRRFLNCTLSWPNDDSLNPTRIKDMPEDVKEKLIDFLGYEINMGRGHGNDNLLGIYHKYKHLF